MGESEGRQGWDWEGEIGEGETGGWHAWDREGEIGGKGEFPPPSHISRPEI